MGLFKKRLSSIPLVLATCVPLNVPLKRYVSVQRGQIETLCLCSKRADWDAMSLFQEGRLRRLVSVSRGQIDTLCLWSKRADWDAISLFKESPSVVQCPAVWCSVRWRLWRSQSLTYVNMYTGMWICKHVCQYATHVKVYIYVKRSISYLCEYVSFAKNQHIRVRIYWLCTYANVPI